MLYDRDIDFWEVQDNKIYIEYLAHTVQATFTREDLEFLLGQLDKGEICTHDNREQLTVNDAGLQVVWVYSGCQDCGYTERVPIFKDLSVGDKETLSGEKI